MARRLSHLLLLTLLVGACGYESSGTTTSTTVPVGDEPPAMGPAGIEVLDQRIEGSSMTVDSLSLPSAGWVVARADVQGSPGEMLGISELLPAGLYADVPVPFFVPITETTVVHLSLHIDVDEDGTFLYEPPDSFIDEIGVLGSGDPATASATVELLPPLGPGDILFGDQTTNGESVVVAQAVLPAPGFVVLREFDQGEAGAVLARTGLLEAGVHTEIVLEPDPTLTASGPVFAAVFVDRDENGFFAPVVEVSDQPLGDEVAVRDDGSLVLAQAEMTVVLDNPGAITVSDQEGGGSLLVIDEVVLPSAGFVEILADAGGQPGEQLIVSGLTAAGSTVDIVLELAEAVEEDTDFWVRLWADFDGDEQLTDADLAVLDRPGGDVVQESFTLEVIE